MILKSLLTYKNKINNNIIINLFCVTLFIISFFIRLPVSENLNYYNSDATWHTLLTIEAYDQNPISIHKFLPINTFGDESNKFITNGPSLINDIYGNNYYISFSPVGFVAPYLFMKAFGLPINELSLYIFNSILCLLSLILLIRLFKCIFNNIIDKKYITLCTTLIYLFQNEIMHSQGIVYWHQSIFQVMLILQILMFIKYDSKKRNIMFWIISLLNPYIEWTGYISNIGFAIAFIFKDIKILNRKIVLSLKSIGQFFSIIIITISSFALFTIHYLLNIPAKDYFNELTRRFLSRNASSGSISVLMSGYLKSYGILIIFLILLLTITLLIKQTRKLFLESLKQNYIVWIVILFPSLENLVMIEHASTYSFDRMKVIIVLILIFFTIFSVWKQWLNRERILKLSSIVILLIISALNVMSYKLNDNHYIWKEQYLENNNEMSKFINSKYKENNSILVKEGFRSWGYGQMLFNRNIYCTDFYPVEECINLSFNKKNDYTIFFTNVTGQWDKTRYDECLIYNNNTSNVEKIKINKYGKTIIEETINKIKPSSLSDENWVQGILNNSNAILFENNVLNMLILKNSKKISCNGYSVDVLKMEYDDLWIRLYVDFSEDTKNFAYPNEIEVIK
ncbi:hypothetical protein [Clostridium butyricum]|uniref:hypothetical protein n=1 Tax=Clostridium butyricum TaxID=1492 RepID=UPI001F562B2D|nr:hypothetical protein [Clostridium butyricum]